MISQLDDQPGQVVISQVDVQSGHVMIIQADGQPGQVRISQVDGQPGIMWPDLPGKLRLMPKGQEGLTHRIDVNRIAQEFCRWS